MPIDSDTPTTIDEVDKQLSAEAPAPAAPAPAPRAPRAASTPDFDVAKVRDLVSFAADNFGVDKAVLAGMIMRESNLDPDVISGKRKSTTGAAGIAQFMPDTAKRFGVDVSDPVSSIMGAAAYLKELHTKFGGDYDKAVAGYNWGENRKVFDQPDWRDHLPAETRDYVAFVNEFAKGSRPPAAPERDARMPLPAGVKPNENLGRSGVDSRRLDNPGPDNGVYDPMTGARLGEGAAPDAPSGEPNMLSQTGNALKNSFGIGAGNSFREAGLFGSAPGESIVSGAMNLKAAALEAAAGRSGDVPVDIMGNPTGEAAPELTAAEAAPGYAAAAAARQNARDASGQAEWTRQQNISKGTLAGKIGGGLLDAGQSAVDHYSEQLGKESPELVRQQANVDAAVGFVDNLKAAATNPLATMATVAQSAPDTIIGAAVGMGIAKVARVGLSGAADIAEKAAREGVWAKAPMMTQSPAEITVIANSAGKAAREQVMAHGAEKAAGIVGNYVEGSQSGQSTNLQVRDFINQTNSDGTPKISDEQLAQNSPRFAELIKSQGPQQARLTLAAELGDEAAPMAALWTRAAGKLSGAAEAEGKLLANGRISGRTFVQNLAKEGLEEGMQNPGEDYAAFASKVQADPTQTYDVGGSIAQGVVGGLAQAGPMHGSGYLQSRFVDAHPSQVSYTEKGSASEKAGLTPITIPDMPAVAPMVPEGSTEETNYGGVQSALAELAASSGHPPGGNGGGGLGDAGPGAAVAGSVGADAGASATGGVDDVGSGAPGSAGPEGAPAALAPAETWKGRSGLGFTTAKDAAQAIPGRALRSPALNWTAELGADGRYTLNGYPKTDVDAHADRAATSPTNNLAQPTDGQKEAGNYQKGHTSIDGMQLAIENPRGSERSGTDKDGKPWSVTMQHHYGYIKGSEGADGDHIDTIVGPHTTSGRAFVVDQVHPSDGTFDEHKVVLGARSREEALATYQANYAPGWKGAAGITEMPTSQLKVWAKSGVRSQPLTNLKGITDDERTAAETAAVAGGRADVAEAPVVPASSEAGSADSGRSGLLGARLDGEPVGAGGAAAVGSPQTARVGRALTSIQDSRLKQYGEAVKLHEIAPGSSKDTDYASALAKVFGKPIVFAHLEKPKGSAGFSAAVSHGVIVVTDDAQDPHVALATHEVVHTMDPDIKQALFDAVLPHADRAAFEADHSYPADKVDEEIVARLAQQHAKTPEFWNQIAEKMGAAPFAKLARHILKSLQEIVGKYKANNLTRYAKNIDAVRDALTTAFAEQAKRSGTKVKEDDSFSDNVAARAAELAAAERPAPARSSIKFFDGSLKVPHLKTNYEIARYFTERNARGMDNRSSHEYRKRMVEALRADVLYALQQPGNGVGWYDAKVKAALAIYAESHPEIATDPQAKFGFTVMLAITSNGTDVNTNAEHADKLYREWKSTGKWPVGAELTTKNAAPMQAGLAKVGELVAQHGWEKVRDFMVADRQVREIEKMTGQTIASEQKDSHVYGAVFLGSKIGAFFNNLYGNFTPVTMDRWFMRSINRIRGNMLALPANFPKLVDKLESQLQDGIDTLGIDGQQMRREIAAYRNLPEDAKVSTVLDALKGVAQYAKLRHKSFAKPNAEGKTFAVRDGVNVLGKMLDEGMTLDEQTPDGGSDRRQLREIMRELQANLKDDGIIIEMADLQAALWYHEKGLFDLLKGAAQQDNLFTTDRGEDYETAARRLQRLGEQESAGTGRGRPAQRKAGRVAERATEQPALFSNNARDGALINIGLDTPDGEGISAAEAITMLKRAGVSVVSHEVHQSNSEPTLVAKLDRALTPAEAHKLSVDLRQESVAQHADGEGELYGPKAAEWRPFNPQFFITPGGTRMAEAPLEGLPATVRVDGKEVTFGPFAPARKAAADYVAQAGITTPQPTKYLKVDPVRARKIASAFALMKDAPQDPKVKAAYAAMIEETKAQYRAILATGLKVEFNDGADPYGNPRNAILDVVKNNHLYVFSTKDGFGSDASFDVTKNPLLAETEFKFGDKSALANDVFRAVHDYFGHVKEGVGFRADGEENAWRSHVAMYTPLARRAMTTETRGQNSWVNFGPKAAHNATASGADTVYADQKIGLLPEWVSDEAAFSDNPFPTIDSLALVPKEDQRVIKRKVSDHSDIGEPMNRIQHQVDDVPAEDPEAIASLREIATPEHANLFVLPKSEEKTLRAIVNEESAALPDGKFEMMQMTGVDFEREKSFVITTPDDKSAFINIREAAPHGERNAYSRTFGENGNGKVQEDRKRPGENRDAVNRKVEEVYIDVSRLQPGSGMGAHIYNMAMSFAHNTNRIFIGDPNGVSNEAMARRPHQMLSSALKFGTTAHLAPHPAQLEGSKNVPALDWVYGDDDANVTSLIHTIVDSKYNQRDGLTFNAEDGSFTDARGVQHVRPDALPAGGDTAGRDGVDAPDGRPGVLPTASRLSPVDAGRSVGEASPYSATDFRRALLRAAVESGESPLVALGQFAQEHGDSLDGVFYSDNVGEGEQEEERKDRVAYAAAPQNLMGFRKDKPSKTFAEQKYKHVEFVRVTFPGGDSILEAQRGLNKPHALERARRNWSTAEIVAVPREIVAKEDPSLVTEVDAAMKSGADFSNNPPGPNTLGSIIPPKPPAPPTRATNGWILSRDALGNFRFGAGEKLYQVVSNLAHQVASKIDMAPISPELKRAIRQMKMETEKSQMKTAQVATEMAKMSPAHREMVSDIIEGELKAGVTPPKQVLEIAASVSALMSQQSDDLIAVGMLTQEAADKWRDKYLPRFYTSKMGDNLTAAWDKAVAALTRQPSGLTGIGGKSLKRRGLTEVIDAKDLANYQAQGWEIDDKGYQPGVTATVQMHRDFTRAERDKMGEVRDSMFRFVMGYTRSQKDLALGRLYEHLADTMASRHELPGYVKVPETTIDGTDANTYGKLAGMFVPQEVLSHLSSFSEGEHEAVLKAYRKALGMWKEGKTVLNPVSHMNNVASNLTMAHFAGVSYWEAHKYVAAMRDFVTGGGMLQEAKEAGLFGGTISQAELMNMMPKELQILAKTVQSPTEKNVELVWNAMSLFLRKPLGVAYQAEDLFFRHLIYREARAKGLHENDAVDYAQKFIFTYDDLPKLARTIRDMPVGMPFFSYTYKVVPVLAHTLLAYPHRYAAPWALLTAINTIAYAVAQGNDDNDDWKDAIRKYVTDPAFRQKAKAKEAMERVNLPPWMKGDGFVMHTPKTLRLGVDDLTQLPVFLDTSRLFPGGDLLDVSSNTGGTPWLQNLTPSNPIITTLNAMLLNRDSYFGKDIVDSNDTNSEAAMKRGQWLWSQFAPALTINNYVFNRSMNAVANATGKEVTWWPEDFTGIGRDGLPVQPKYAAMQNIGIKARTIDLDASAQMAEGQKKKMIRDLDGEIRSLRRLANKGALSQDSVEKKIDFNREKQRRLRSGNDVDDNPKE